MSYARCYILTQSSTLVSHMTGISTRLKLKVVSLWAVTRLPSFAHDEPAISHLCVNSCRSHHTVNLKQHSILSYNTLLHAMCLSVAQRIHCPVTYSHMRYLWLTAGYKQRLCFPVSLHRRGLVGVSCQYLDAVSQSVSMNIILAYRKA